MFKKINFVLLLILPCSINIAAAQEADDFGAVPFVNFVPDARSAAMGGVGVALSAGSYAVFHNPASVAFSDNRAEFAYSYAPWMRDVASGSSLNSVAGYYRFDDKRGISAAFRHFTNHKVEWMDGHGNPKGTHKPKEWAMDIAYSRLLGRFWSASGTLKYISSDLGSFGGADKASTVAFDIALMCSLDMLSVKGGKWGVGMKLSNVGSKMKYGEEKHKLPSTLMVGVSAFVPLNEGSSLEFALDAGTQYQPSDASGIDVGIGAEYRFLRYALLRAGFHADGKDSKNNYGSFGAGIRAGHIRGDVSYWATGSDSMLKNTFCISVGVAF